MPYAGRGQMSVQQRQDGPWATPLNAADVAGVRRPVDQAHLLPARVFHDPAVFDFEQESWFARTWLCVGREESVAEPGTYMLARAAGESVIIMRDRQGVLRAVYNVCRHRGSTLLDEPGTETVASARSSVSSAPTTPGSTTSTARSAARRTPKRSSTSSRPTTASCRFASTPGRASCSSTSTRTPSRWSTTWPTCRASSRGYPIGSLRSARRIEYDVAANWKVIGENYSECYHCPGVHPQLNRLSPYDRGENLESAGPWAGGWMELVAAADTMSTDGGSHGRPPLRASARRAPGASTTWWSGRTCCSASTPTTS